MQLLFRILVAASCVLLAACGNTRLVYVADNEIRTVADDGTGDRSIGATSFGGVAWRSDRDEIVYIGDKNTSCAISARELFTVNANGSGRSSLTRRRCAAPGDACAIVDPDANANGEIVAVHEYAGSQCETTVHTLITMSSSGTGLKVLPGVSVVGSGGQPDDPHWSPDGESIVFEVNGDIYTLPAVGGTPCQVNTGGTDGRKPVWGRLQGKSTIAYISDGDIVYAQESGSSGGCATYDVQTLPSPETETRVAFLTSLLAAVRQNGSGSTIVLIDPINNNAIRTIATSNDTIRDLDW